MSTGSWHCDDALLGAYTGGRTDPALSASVETHLVACATCRAALARTTRGTDPAPLDAIWSGVREAIQAPALPGPLRLLRRLGLRDEDAVLLSASQSLRGPWLLATVTLLVFASLAAIPGGEPGTMLYLLVAPLVPVAGVVVAFASADPTVELVAATPYSRVRIALLRTVAVIVTSVPLVAAMGLLVPPIGLLSVAALGPGLLLALVALVALAWVPAESAGGSLGLAWVLVVGLAYGRHDVVAVVRPGAQLVYLVLAALAAAVLLVQFRSARHVPGGHA